jgi:reactive intermediate/imine deaminase
MITATREGCVRVRNRSPIDGRNAMNRYWMVPLAFACTFAACAQDTRVEYFPRVLPPDFPFSVAVRVGDMLYLAGQIGDDDNGALVPGGIEAETRRALENLRDELEVRGSSLDRVVRCLVMMADIGEWERMNKVYLTFFPRNRPARSAMGANGLVLGARVEIECTAVVG